MLIRSHLLLLVQYIIQANFSSSVLVKLLPFFLQYCFLFHTKRPGLTSMYELSGRGEIGTICQLKKFVQVVMFNRRICFEHLKGYL